MANARNWTQDEIIALTDGSGRHSLTWLQKQAGQPHTWPNAPKYRSRQAIYAQAHRQHGPGGLTRGVYTLVQVLRATGYSKSHFIRAREALNQRWHRIGPRGAYLIDEEQSEEITEWLRTDYWSKAKKLHGCVWCSTSRFPMHAFGLCRRDYLRYRRRCEVLNLPIDPKKQLGLLGETNCIEIKELLEQGIAISIGQLTNLCLKFSN